MITPTLSTLLGTGPLRRALVAGLLTLVPLAAVQADQIPGRLVLSAEGSVAATPDRATVTTGAVTQAGSAEAAMAGQRERMSRVIAELKARGVDPKDIQTAGLDLSPVYSQSHDRAEGPQIVAYRASNDVTVLVRDLAMLGPSLDALVAAGANQIRGIRFGVSNEDELADQARRAAIKALLARRDLYAEAAGLKLGRIIEMSESGGYRPEVVPMMAMRSAAMKDSTPVEAGTVSIQIGISAVFEIEE
ncbi:MAG: SIMPL domain-containing protein [Pseudomonadota bacterium]|nr:SIMPL domain-containing protein [Pseudomonadota bacterium]